ncbi:MAG: hypothetical protein ACK4RF_05320 [Cyclobacteriaceae bacterium]
MKVALLSVCLCSTVAIAFAQFSYDRGYYVDNNGERIEGLIKRLDGAYNPDKIEFKENENASPVTLNVMDVSEFGIEGQATFYRFSGNIDRSSLDLNKAGTNRNPEWRYENLFLKILVRGDAKLYEYKDYGLTRYFFQTKVTEIEQLVYKVYYPKSNQVAYNKMYLAQLQNTLICEGMPSTINVPYDANALIKLFQNYNSCMGSESVVEKSDMKGPVIVNINFRPGINYSTFTITGYFGVGQYTTNFRSKVTGRVGLEIELYPSFNNRNKKWSVTIEPNYHYYNDEFMEGTKAYTSDYRAIELPISLRKYFYRTNGNSIFLNFGIVLDYPMGNSGGKMTISSLSGNTELNYTIEASGITYSAGIGFSVKRFLTEIRLYSNRSLVSSTVFDSSFSTIALVMGYRLLK